MHVEMDRAWLPCGCGAVRYLSITLHPMQHAESVQLALKRSFAMTASVIGSYPVRFCRDVWTFDLGGIPAGRKRSLLIAVRGWGGYLNSKVLTATLSVTDVKAALSSTPLEVEWDVLPAEAGAERPVNADVLVIIAEHIRDQVRDAAEYASACGALARLTELCDRGAKDIRALLPGHPAIHALAGELERFADARETDARRQGALPFLSPNDCCSVCRPAEVATTMTPVKIWR